jgi:hypothetical protein
MLIVVLLCCRELPLPRLLPLLLLLLLLLLEPRLHSQTRQSSV